MAKRAQIICRLLGCLMLLVGSWWILAPKIGNASEAEIRGRVAPELLLPLPHPDGGVARYMGLRMAVDAVMDVRFQPARGRADPIDVADPAVRRVLDILATGALDRSYETYPSWIRLVSLCRGLGGGALSAAQAGDWKGVQRQIDAEILLWDRLFESDAVVADGIVSGAIETDILQVTLDLAARRDLPAEVAQQFSTRIAAIAQHPLDLQRLLRGEFQLNILAPLVTHRIPDFFRNGVLWTGPGTLDPLATASLVNDGFMEVLHNAGLPESRRSKAMVTRIQQPRREMEALFGNPGLSSPRGLRFRFYMNTGRNTLGSWLAAKPQTQQLLDEDLELRTRREQVLSALAISRFRHPAGRDPDGFQELIAAGLLQAAPMNYATEQSLPFDLGSLFDWAPVPGH